MSAAAGTVLLAGAGTGGGTDIRNGEVDFLYPDGPSPAATIRAALGAGSGVMNTGTLRRSLATATRGLGYKEDGALGAVIVKATLFGDADLDGGVSINDFNALAGNFGQTLPASSEMWAGLLAFAAAHDDLIAFEAVTGVPEPTAIVFGAVACGILCRRRRPST